VRLPVLTGDDARGVDDVEGVVDPASDPFGKGSRDDHLESRGKRPEVVENLQGRPGEREEAFLREPRAPHFRQHAKACATRRRLLDEANRALPVRGNIGYVDAELQRGGEERRDGHRDSVRRIGIRGRRARPSRPL